MRSFLKIILVPAGLALAGGLPANAAPANAAPPAQIERSNIAAEATPVNHTWRHTQNQRWRRAQRYQYRYRPYRPYYAPRYNYGPRYRTPRCYWSRYYQRRICR